LGDRTGRKYGAQKPAVYPQRFSPGTSEGRKLKGS